MGSGGAAGPWSPTSGTGPAAPRSRRSAPPRPPPDVERLEDLDAAGVAVALDGGDDRRRRPEVLEKPLVDEADVGPDPLLELVRRRLARDQRADQPVEVGAGREVAAGPGQDGGPDAVVGVDHVPGVAQPAQDLGVERVLLVGTVEREG